MEIRLHDIADPFAIAVATGSTGIVAQVVAYQMVVQTKEYPPATLADATYVATTLGEMIQALCPVEFIGVPNAAQEEAVEEDDQA